MSLGFECCILSQEDFIHTTLADLLDDFVMANGRPDHEKSPPLVVQKELCLNDKA